MKRIERLGFIGSAYCAIGGLAFFGLACTTGSIECLVIGASFVTADTIGLVRFIY